MKTNKSPILPLIPSPDDKAGMGRYMQSVNQFLQDLSLNARADLDEITANIPSMSGTNFRVGMTTWSLEEITLSASIPWLQLSSPTATLNASNFVDYVPFLRGISSGPRWSSAVLTGTITLAATAITGSSTNFDPELTVGDLVFIEKLNQFRYIATRTSDTAATVSEPGTAAAGARMWKITRAASKVTTFPITSYQITAADSFSLWLNESSTTKQPENYIMMQALAEAHATDREYGTITLPSAIGGIPAGDYQITSITLSNVGTSSAVIVCSASGLTGGAETADTSNISIYPHRIAGSTTTARHYEVTDAALMSDGMYNVLGMRTRDSFQRHYHYYSNSNGAAGGVGTTVVSTGTPYTFNFVSAQEPVTDALNETPRTGPRTKPRAMIGNLYVYIGEYTA